MNRKVDLNFESNVKQKHVGIICRVCFKSDFLMHRYKCLVCEEFDLCSHCYESYHNKSIQDHDVSHLMVKLSEPNKIDGFTFDPNMKITLDLIKDLSKYKVHENSKCSCCNIGPIKQIRLKCDICLDYELCFECYKNKKMPQKPHLQNHSYNFHPILVENKHSLEIEVDKIELLEEIGSGLTSRIYKAKIGESSKIYACKHIILTHVESELGNLNRKKLFLNYLDELKTQNELNSVNKINLCAYAIDKNYDSIYLLTEYMENKDLRNFLTYSNQLTYQIRIKLAVDIAHGIYRLHSKRFAHKCIYPDNILIDSDLTAKINVFRFNFFLYESNRKNYPLTYINMPKEFFERNFTLNTNTDIFSFGLTLLDLFGGDYEIEYGKVKILKEAKIFHKLVLKCIQSETERPIAEEIYEYFKLYYSYVKYKLNCLKSASTTKTKKKSESDLNTFIIESIRYYTDKERHYDQIEDFISFMRAEITEVIHRCFFCNLHNFNYYKYQCLVCKDFYLCNKCFEHRMKNENHKLCHPLIRFEQTEIESNRKNLDSNLNIESYGILFKNKIHENSACKACKIKPIKGIRFKCDICYDFTLCYTCFSKRSDIKYESKVSNTFPFKKEFKTHLYESHPMIIDNHTESKLEYDDVHISDRSIGKGGFGIVYRGFVKQTGLNFACKRFLDPERSLLSFLRELYNYQEIKGENILRMIGFFFHQSSMFILTELMERGDLEKLLLEEKNLSYFKRLKIAVDIASGTARIHEKGFIHKDIRPANIFISFDYTAKIGDFGTVKLKDETNTGSACIAYMPKEFFPPIQEYNQKLDVFTLGLTYLELFNGKHTKSMMTRIIQKPFVFKGLINECTAQKKDFNRPKSKRVYDFLNRCYLLLKNKMDKNSTYYRVLSFEEEKNAFKETHDQEFVNIRL